MYQVRLRDGSLYDVNWCGESDGILTISAVSSGTLTDYAVAFGDAEKTQRIEFLYDSSVSLFEGYTFLTFVSDSRWRGGDVTISLRKPVRNGGMQ